MTQERVREWIRGAAHVAVLTGAGMSAESGVPTFRDAQTGLWAQFDPQQLATEAGFRADPATVWNWYAFRRELIAKVAPNAGHLALAAYSQRHPGRLSVITQNVDGLHEQAASEVVFALHGNIFDDRWLDPARPCCNAQAAVPGSPPRCPTCSNMLRPGVVWFGESLPEYAFAAAEAAVRKSDLMLVVGTSGLVYPAAGLVQVAGGKVVIINPAPTDLDDAANAVLRGTAAQLLPELLGG